MKKRLELLAEIQHEIWSHWMKYMFTVCKKGKDGSMVIPAEKVYLWKLQLNTPYNSLSSKERQSDRDVVAEYDIENRLDRLS